MGVFTQSVKMFYYGIPQVVSGYGKTTAAAQFMKNYPIPPFDAALNVWTFTALSIMLVSTVSLNTFGQEQAVFLRDAFSGTKAVPYWFAKTLEAALWLPLNAAVYVGICFAMQPVPIMFLEFFIVIWVAMIGFYGVGHVVSLLFGKYNRGIVHLVVCLVLIMVFSGVLLKYHGKWYFDMFFTFWTSQTYYKGAIYMYETAFDVEKLNEYKAGFNWSYPWWFDTLCALLTSLIWHLFALMIIFYRTL